MRRVGRLRKRCLASSRPSLLMRSLRLHPAEGSRVRVRAFPLRFSAAVLGFRCCQHPPPPNKSFKPTPHRGVNSVLYATLHAVAAPLWVGLTPALGIYGESTVDAVIEVSLDRIKTIISALPPEFSTADVIRKYCGGFHSNLETPAYYSFNAQFGKLLKHNDVYLGISQEAESISIRDDNGHPTNSSTWRVNA